MMINKTLNFLTINDVYTLQKNWRGQGGLAEMKTMVNKYKKKYPNSIFTLNGDFLSASTLSQKYHGKQMIDVLNYMELDFVAVGNHEIEIGNSHLDERVQESKFTWLCANVIDPKTNEIYAGFKDYEIKIIDGVKVGFFGLITKHIYHYVKKREGIDFIDPISTTKKILEIFNSEKVDIIICLSHMDWDEDKELARRFPSINLILGGHNHNAATYIQGDTLIIKAGTNAEYLGHIKLDLEISILGHNGSSVKNINVIPTWKLIPNKGFEPDHQVNQIIQNYTEKLDDSMLEPLAILKSNLDSRSNFVRSVETSMSNLLADAIKDYFGGIVDLVMISAGSIRGDRLYSYGDKITLHDLHNEFPFKNPLKLVQLSGKHIKSLFEEGLSKAELVLGSFPVVSKGVKILFDFGKSSFNRVLSCTLNEQNFEDEKLYYVVTTCYLSSGGDGYISFKNSIDCEHPHNMCSMFQVMETYIRKNSSNLKSLVEGRIVAL